MSKSVNYLLFLIFSISAVSCSGLRHLPAGQKLYTGAEVKLESSDNPGANVKRKVRAIAENALRPMPNKKFFGMRPKLWMYLSAGENPHGLKKWLKKKGEPPVLIDDVDPAAISEVIDANLFNNGIFRSSTRFRIDEKDRVSKVIYTSSVHKPFRFKELTLSIPDENVTGIILEGKEKSLIRPGKKYNLEVINKERTRIDELLKNKGYYNFNPDYLIFKADTSEKKYTVSLDLQLKDSIPQNALTVYHINNVNLDQKFSLTGDSGLQSDSIVLSSGSGMTIRPRTLSKFIFVKENEIYSAANHKTTLYRLMSIGTFKFVNIRYSDSDTTAPGYLDASVLMTPVPKHTFSTEVDIVTKSNNFTGPRLNLSYLNKNAFKRADLLKFNLAGSYEAQFGSSNLYYYSFNPEIELNFPRFLVPFYAGRTSKYVQKTRFLVSYNSINRVDYFNMRIFQFTYGFRWNENVRKEHEFDPVNINYTLVTNRTQAFNDFLEENPYLKENYENQFIAGASYSYTYNEQMVLDKRIQYFLKLSTETAGNIFSLAKIIGGEDISSQNPATVAGSVYSQFSRISLDGRMYYNFANSIKKNRLVLRLYGGIGIPYGNSPALPYTRQFFSGGPTSLRAFPYNSVGPGTIQQNTEEVFLPLGGELKFETNVEYRFNIFRFFKGAVFTDAGNVWNLKSDPLELNSSFSASKFFDELAVGSGLGFRFDFSFVVLRFDLAMPLRKPWLEENNRWVIDDIDFGSSVWRRENLILNVVIGYPF